jgi:alpha-beta hydrolase superfamily lysophospholipase
MADTDRKFPVISFGHGFMLSAESYRHMADWLVPEGFVVVFPLKERGLHPSHAMLAEDLAFAIRQLSLRETESNSLFFNRIDSVGYVMGHSMGGGSAVLAAASHPEIKGLVLFAPFNTAPSAIEAAKRVDAPVLIFAGSHDCVTPPDSHQVPIYEALASYDKTLISITGGTHCGMTAPDVLCSLGELTCRSGKGLDRDQQHAILSRYLLPWLKSRIKGGGGEPELMLKMLMKDEQVTYLISTF